MDLLLILLPFGLAAGTLLMWYRIDRQRENLRARLLGESPRATGAPAREVELLRLRQLHNLLQKSPLTRRAQLLLLRGELPLTLPRAAMALAATSLLGAAAAFAVHAAPWAAVLGALLLPLAAWSGLGMYVDGLCARRERLLPGLVAQLLSSLRSGATPLLALQHAARVTTEPLGRTLRVLQDSIQIGVPPAQAWQEWALRCGGRHAELLATGVRLKWEAGGQMSAMLEHILESMQSRERMILRVRTLTTQARLGSYVLIALPIVFMLFTYYNNPRIFEFVVNDPIGVVALWAGGGLLIVGFFWMRRLSRLEM